MDQLFAPWRIEWVTREDRIDPDGCVFCALPHEDDHREALVVAETEHSYVLLNNAPYNPGHVMVIPRRHVTDPRELGDDEMLDQERLVARTVDALESTMRPDGFNTGRNIGDAGGGSIAHVHTHVVPRWRGDTNFMAVIDGSKVIVQALDDTYEALHAAFADQEDSTGSDDTRAVRIRFD